MHNRPQLPVNVHYLELSGSVLVVACDALVRFLPQGTRTVLACWGCSYRRIWTISVVGLHIFTVLAALHLCHHSAVWRAALRSSDDRAAVSVHRAFLPGVFAPPLTSAVVSILSVHSRNACGCISTSGLSVRSGHCTSHAIHDSGTWLLRNCINVVSMAGCRAGTALVLGALLLRARGKPRSPKAGSLAKAPSSLLGGSALLCVCSSFFYA